MSHDPNDLSSGKSQPLSGTTAVVTGASSGIGKQIAIRFAAAGCSNLLLHCHRHREGAEQTAAQVRSSGCDAIVDQANFADAFDTSQFINRTLTRFARIDSWVHCAGADVLTGDAAAWTFEQKLKQLIEVDLVGSITTGRAVGSHFRKQASKDLAYPPPSLIFIGWDQATAGMEADAGQMFAPIKAAVEAFANSLAQELAPAVRVNTIAPGWIKTSWGECTSDYWNQRAKGQSLMNRWGTPDDVADAAIFLATPTHTFFTGQTIVVNGGWNRRFVPQAPSSHADP